MAANGHNCGHLLIYLIHVACNHMNRNCLQSAHDGTSRSQGQDLDIRPDNGVMAVRQQSEK